MKRFTRELLQIRATELLSTLAASYWLFLSLLSPHAAASFGSYRALTNLFPRPFWAVFFAAACIMQQMISRTTRREQGFLRLATGILWLAFGAIELRQIGLVGPVVWILWVIGVVVLRSALIDFLNLPLRYR